MVTSAAAMVVGPVVPISVVWITSPAWSPVSLTTTGKIPPPASACDTVRFAGVSAMVRAAVIVMFTGGEDLVVSSVEVAVIVAVPDAGAVAGAV